MSSVINGIRDWAISIIRAIPATELLMPGYPFHPAAKEERLDALPLNIARHRAFQVRFRRNFGTVGVIPLPLERRQTMIVRVGYLGWQDDDELEGLVDDDEEVIQRYLIQISTAGWPTGLFNIKGLGSSDPTRFATEENNEAVVEHYFEVRYRVAVVS